MKLRRKLKANYSKEELEKADILEAYTRLLSGEKLSRRQRKLLHSQRYEEELAPLKKIVDFTHQQSEMMLESIVPSTVVSRRVETNLMNLIKGNQISTPAFVENLQPAYDIEPMGADSQLSQMEYEYGVAEEPIFQKQQSRDYLLRMRIVEGDEIGRDYRVEIPEIILGRGKDATIKLEEDSKVSRNHAQLTVYNGDIYITDLDSSNGTYVDGQLIEERAQLVIGSQVRLGDSLIVVSDVQCLHRDVPPEFIIRFKELTDNDMGKEYAVTIREITIGRGFDAQIRLLDSTEKLSRIHAKLDVYKGDIYIIDLNSSNGTYVDGKKITGSHKLSIGAKVKLGGVVIQILSIEP
ncbi:TPA: FHA domain-containing protein [Candidatus Poribacteria bacterium]|nr:FHA domain-containing protein [Candidatus Poribacteria bacterium]